WLETDLDARLAFRPGLVALTDRRLLARSPDDGQWHDWICAPGLRLSLHDHAGAAALELHDGPARLAAWRFTLARNPAALRLLAKFDALQAGRQAAHAPACPDCHLP